MSAASTANERVRELGRPGRRVLGVSEYGDVDGFPVIACHGIPGTRLMFRPTQAVAQKLKLRLIAPDRPGFGRSTPQENRTLRDWPLDVEAVLDAYGIDRFAILGVSGGGPFAVATAAHFGDRVAAMSLISPMGPVAEFPDRKGMRRLTRVAFLDLPRVPLVLRLAMLPAHGLFRVSPGLQYDMVLRALPAVDRAILSSATLKAGVIEDIRESLKQGGDGARADLKIFSQPWQVDFTAITARTDLWQGLADTIVPVDVALWLGELIPNCTVHRIADAGHFWVYENIERVLTALGEPPSVSTA